MEISYEARKELFRFICLSSCVCSHNPASVDYLLFQEDIPISYILEKMFSDLSDFHHTVGTNRDHNDTLSGLRVLIIGEIKIFSKILNPFLITTNWISTKMSTFTHIFSLKIFIFTLVHIDAMGTAFIKLKALKMLFWHMIFHVNLILVFYFSFLILHLKRAVFISS